MKRNLYKETRSHRGKYLNIDMHTHHSRECHTFSHAHIHPLNTVDSFFVWHYTKHNALISTGNNMLSKQHAKATVSQTLCYIVTRGYPFDLSSFWNNCRDHSRLEGPGFESRCRKVGGSDWYSSGQLGLQHQHARHYKAMAPSPQWHRKSPWSRRRLWSTRSTCRGC